MSQGQRFPVDVNEKLWVPEGASQEEKDLREEQDLPPGVAKCRLSLALPFSSSETYAETARGALNSWPCMEHGCSIDVHCCEHTPCHGGESMSKNKKKS